MEYIVLDTSIFIKENFLAGKRIQTLFDLSKKDEIILILPKITIEEVKANFKKYTKKAINNFKEFKKPIESKVLKNTEEGKNLFPLLFYKDIVDKFNSDFEELIYQSNVLVLDYTEINIKNVFNKYFNNDVPFGTGDKKHEFPDAFSLELIENWSKKFPKPIDCIVFSMDKDFLKYESGYFEVRKNYDTYIDNKLSFILERKNLKKPILEKLFVSNSNLIDAYIKEWYEDKLSDITLYYSVIWVEIHNISVINIEINDKKYQIVSVDKETIEIEIDMSLSFEVQLTIDDEEEGGIYDKEIGTMYYFDTTIKSITQETSLKLSCVAFINDKLEFEKEIEIIDMNEDELIIETDDDMYR